MGALPQSPAIIGCYCNAIDLAASFTHYTAGSKKGTFGHGTTLKVDNRLSEKHINFIFFRPGSHSSMMRWRVFFLFVGDGSFEDK